MKNRLPLVSNAITRRRRGRACPRPFHGRCYLSADITFCPKFLPPAPPLAAIDRPPPRSTSAIHLATSLASRPADPFAGTAPSARGGGRALCRLSQLFSCSPPPSSARSARRGGGSMNDSRVLLFRCAPHVQRPPSGDCGLWSVACSVRARLSSVPSTIGTVSQSRPVLCTHDFEGTSKTNFRVVQARVCVRVAKFSPRAVASPLVVVGK